MNTAPGQAYSGFGHDIRDFSHELGTGIVMQGDSTTYMATELIDFLGTRRAGAKTLQENKGSMERTPYTFYQLMGESSPSTKNL